MAAPKIDPFQDGEALDDVSGEAQELATPEGGEAQETQQADTSGGIQQEAHPEGLQQGKEPQSIPYPRFKEVIDARTKAETERDALKKERDALNERWARLDERRNVLTEAQRAEQQRQVAAEQAAQRPDPMLDPTGAQLWDQSQQIGQLLQTVQALQSGQQQLGGTLQQTQEQAEFNGWVDVQARSYSQQDPKYFEKARYAADYRINFWQQMGMTPENARKRVEQESFLIAAEAKTNGVNFAPIVAKLAESWGYQDGAPAQNGNGQARNGNNALRIQQAQAGQRVQGLGHLPGSGGENSVGYRQYTAAQIAQMTEAEFSRAMANPKSKADLQYAMSMADGIEPGTGRY